MDIAPKAKDPSMTIVMLALLVALVVVTAIVLADSGLRLWSAVGSIRAQQQAGLGRRVELPRTRPAARVTMQINYARSMPSQAAPSRAAA